ncbi:hypothetical protein [Nocardia sp. NPDC049707]|uniref:hypothetical protein n=1 Tax=Nocardia sp. NPDC049707 TaxID=3154735 RepID=UPI00343487AC
MPEAERWRSRPMLIASMLPLALVLGTGVAAASPDDTAQAPAMVAALGQSLADTAPPGDIAPLVDMRRGDRALLPMNRLAADRWTRIRTVDAPAAADQRPIEAFCEQFPVDPRRCSDTAVDAGVGAIIGAGIGAGVSAPVAIAAGMVGAAAGFVVGIPFMPTGLVVGPLLGAAVGVAVVAGPAALLGGAFGASLGTILGTSTTPLPLDGFGAPITPPT